MTRFQMLPALLALTGTLAACGGPDGDYPALVPMEELLATPGIPEHAATAMADPAPTQGDLDGQAAALRARAEALRHPVIDAATAARMRDAQARHN